MLEEMPKPIERHEIVGLIEEYEDNQGISEDISHACHWYVKEAYDLSRATGRQVVKLCEHLSDNEAYADCVALVLVIDAAAFRADNRPPLQVSPFPSDLSRSSE